MTLNAAASGWPKRHAPLRWGVRLIVEAGASSNQACMGLCLNGPKSWALSYGLGLGILGLALKASDLSYLLWRSFGFSCIRRSHFLIIGLSLRASNRECLQFAAFIFLKNRIHALKFFQKINMQRNTHTTYKKNTYLILTFRWGCRFTNQLPLGK